MLRSLVGFLLICLVLMSAKSGGENRLTKAERSSVIENFKTAGHDRTVRREWMTVSFWAKYINKYFPVPGITVTPKNLHDAFRNDGSLKILDLDGKFNTEGIYRNKVKEDGPNVWCYQFRGHDKESGEAFPRYDPPVAPGKKWRDRLFNPFNMKHGLDGWEDASDTSDRDSNLGAASNPNDAENDEAGDSQPDVQNIELPESVRPDGFEADDYPQDAEFFDRSSLPEGTSIWYISTKAIKLFHPKDGQSTVDAIKNRMELCFGVANNTVPLDAVLEMHDVDDTMTDAAKYNARIRCHYIAWALKFRYDNLNSVEDGSKWTWTYCCQKACEKMAENNIFKITNGETVRKWHALFRIAEKFPLMKKEEKRLPHFLQANSDISEAIQKYARENIDSPSLVVTVHEYLHKTLLPKMVSDVPNCNTKEELLEMYGLKVLCHDTVRRWLIKLGFRYDYIKNNYYVDGHEKVDTVRYRWKFIDRYLLLERRMHRWIQMTAEESKQYEGYEKDKIVPGSGYRYKGINPNNDSDDEVEMVEYHVDTLKQFQDIVDASGEKGKYGGWLSVRMKPSERPVICIGQDEAIFKQYIFQKKAWTHNGEKRLYPKDEGYGVMISAFQSREFGFGYPLTVRDLETINAYRAQHSEYADTEAANIILKRTHKMPITMECNPFCMKFEYGASAEGYWTYERMVLQLEDCADVLKALHPEFDFVFLFDHSCGHDRGREDGLNVTKMNSGYGGSQPKMHKTLIKEEAGYLGTYERSLEAGQYQHMIFQEGDVGPFWMTPAQREATKNSEYEEPTLEDKKKDELLEALKTFNIPGIRGRKVEDLKLLCQEHNIPTQKRVRKERVKGWLGKPKGLLQVLWECGFIDTSKNVRSYYSLRGTRDDLGNIIPETSLREMMRNCLDFVEEETMLQTKAKEMGEHEGHITVDRTPKCHPELAGEGIEYSWACAKNYYRRLPLDKKKGKENFKNSVQEAISRDNLTTKRIRMFLRRAREYIVAYKLIHHEKTEDAEPDADLLSSNISASIIEKMAKKFKTHRCALDFDYGFLTIVIKSTKE